MTENKEKTSAGTVLFIDQFDAQINKEHKNVSGNPIFTALVEMESDRLRMEFIDIAKKAHDKLVELRKEISNFMRKNVIKNVVVPNEEIGTDGEQLGAYPSNFTLPEAKAKELQKLRDREQKLNAALLKALDPKDGMNKVSFHNVESLLK
jgi:hypothetical protein